MSFFMESVINMAFKIEKNKNYTIMSNNYHLCDKNLSFKAKCLLSFMLVYCILKQRKWLK